jgi:uncharacterized membrane protein
MRLAIPYLATAVLFVVIDMLWLGVIAKSFYRSQLGTLIAEPMNFTAALAFYLIYAAGLVYFAVNPSLISGGWSHAAVVGAILGFVAYSTYDLSNLATLRGWPVPLTVVDIIWGTILSATTAAGATMFTQWVRS